jgi:hypothetical protein
VGDLELPVRVDGARAALLTLAGTGRLDLPLPGSGRTAERWRALAEVSALDLALGRLAEGHTDAVAILAELGGPAPAGLWGVWAAGAGVTAHGGRLTGRKAWCSGAAALDRALVTADGRLWAIDVADVTVDRDSWPAVGMAGSGTYAVGLDGVPAVQVGAPGAYLDRPGFWHGGAGVAACWYGGALGAARVLLAAARARPLDPHGLAHLGAVDALVTGLWADLEATAAALDADPARPFRLPAARLRARVEAGATEVLDRVGRALGPGPMATDPVHAQRVADLPVYLRQSHAERDLAVLGELAVEVAGW